MLQQAIIETITAKEKEWMQAWIDKDEEKLLNILGDDFLLSSARGRYMNKQEWLQGSLGSFHCEQFHWKDIKVRVYENVAVVNAITEQRARVGGQDWSGVFMVTDIWVFQNDSWKVVARQGTGPLA